MTRLASLILLLSLIVSNSVFAGNASSPVGEPFQELPTLHCLGLRWKIKGDDNKNAVIEVNYRKAGEQAWKKGFPLFRTIPNMKVKGKVVRYAKKGEWMFAGSIIDLTPNTAYDVKLELKDPDGGKGERTLKMKTWKEPFAPKDIDVKHVVPGKGGGTGTKADPFKGLPAATKVLKPGTLFLLHKGTYIKGNFPGNTWRIRKSGLPGKPIIFRGAGDGESILDGGGDHATKGTMIEANGLKHIWFENLTIKGRNFGLGASKSSYMVIRGCKIRECVKFLNAIKGSYNTCKYFLIIDNDFKGSTTWPRTKGIEPYAGTKISGAGHIIAYNKFQNMGDSIHGTGHGNLSASDYHNNDINICTDDGMETDYGEFNIRVFENRIINVAHGITAQPILVGPAYLFRNFMYNVTYSPFKLHNHTTGVLLIHNTCIKKGNCFSIIPGSDTVINVYTRNNLFLGQGGSGLWTGGVFGKNDFDCDGYGGWKGNFTRWNNKKYKTPEDAGKAGVCYTGKGVINIDLKTCFANGMVPPADTKKIYTTKEVDFSLAKNSDAIDKGEVLPNFNDGFTGKAPDLGALEFGTKAPHFGPRTKEMLAAAQK